MCLAKKVMTRDPSVAREDDTIYDVVDIMRLEDCDVVPVVDQYDRCTGIITIREICLEIVLNHLDPETTVAEELMNTDLITCHPDDDMNDVIRKMEREQIRRIPVVDDLDRVVGIITEGDIARSEVKPQLGDLVQAASR